MPDVLRRTTVRVDTADGPADLPGWAAGVPGLVLLDPAAAPWWPVVHERSGAVLMDLPSQSSALRVVFVLGSCGVAWTRPLAELRGRPEVGRVVAGVAAHLGGRIGARQAGDADLNA